MERIIKFRAWDKENSKMVDVIDFSCINYPEKYAVMQFTGLLDRNGKEIFEGDVVRCADYVEDAHAENTWERVVEWDNESGAWMGIDGEKNEVLGNIYEHPHLLRKD